MILSDLKVEPVFYTGAGDPEMDRIEDVLVENGQNFVRTAMNGERVGPGNAYRANNMVVPNRGAIFIECSVADVTPLHVIDHHREGDPGYGLSAERYWEAASIGQLVTFLELEPTYQERVLAAMDHCFAAALRGECPGVEPEDVFNLRIEKMMESQGVPRSEILDLLEDYKIKIDNADEIVIGDGPVKDLRWVDLGVGYSLENLTMGLAQALTGDALLVTESNPGQDTRKKVTIDTGDEDQIEAFMTKWAPEHGFCEVYGVPSRGYAGAYFRVLG